MTLSDRATRTGGYLGTWENRHLIAVMDLR